MSVKTPVSRSRGKRSNTIASPAAICPEPISWPIAVCAPCETMNSSAAAPWAPKTRSTSSLSRSHVSGSPPRTSRPSRDVGAAEHLAGRVERGLAAPLRAPQPRELGCGLATAAILEALPVDDDLHAAAAQVVGELERERRRDDGGRDPELREGADVHLELGLRRGRSRREQLVHPEPLRRQRLDPRIGGDETRHLERAQDGRPGSVPVDVEERIRHRERHLVAHLRRADRVGVEEQRGHDRDPMQRSALGGRPPVCSGGGAARARTGADRELGRVAPAGAARRRGHLRRAHAPRHRHRRHGRPLRGARGADGPLRRLALLRLLPRRARPAARLPRRERPDARVRGALERADDPVRPARARRGADRGGAPLSRPGRARDQASSAGAALRARRRRGSRRCSSSRPSGGCRS